VDTAAARTKGNVRALIRHLDDLKQEKQASRQPLGCTDQFSSRNPALEAQMGLLNQQIKHTLALIP